MVPRMIKMFQNVSRDLDVFPMDSAGSASVQGKESETSAIGVAPWDILGRSRAEKRETYPSLRNTKQIISIHVHTFILTYL